MKISFRDKKLRQLCEVEKAAQRKLGAICARKLRTRLSDLEVASQVSELIAGNPHPLRGDREGQFALNLSGGSRLVFSPDQDPCPKTVDGAIDWAKVTSVCIEFIGDYHD